MIMLKNSDVRDMCTVGPPSKKLNRCRSFHFRYLELCRSKNLTPLPDIRAKNNATAVLDFYGDKIGVNDWLLIVESLYYDQVLQTLGIRMRKNCGFVLDHLDTEKKAKLFRQKPVVYTSFVFSGVVEAISNCIEFNKNLRVLNLEGLPLGDKYVESVAKAMSSNESLKEVSFKRSQIYDKGCEAICNTIKYLNNVEKLNLSDCQLTTKGAEHVADMIKIQKISRYTEGWQKSLRYREVDPDTIGGLRSILLAGNVQICDDGIKPIVEVLKDDVWIKVIDMENCGLTDRGANLILDCLEINNYIIDFNVRNNTGISKFLMRSLRDHLGKDDDEQRLLDGQQQLLGDGDGTVPQRKKVTVMQLREQLKTLEEQLAFERVLRKKAEQLNERLNQQIIAYENQMQEEANATIPEGYIVVKNESLQSIIKERNDFQKLVSKDENNKIQPRTITPHMMVHYTPKQNNITYNDNNQAETSQTSDGAIDTCAKTMKVRKVRSEMKYVETMTKEGNRKKKDSKSDHEFANETDFKMTTVRFETDIGDGPVSVQQLTARLDGKPQNCNDNSAGSNYKNSQDLQGLKSGYINHNTSLNNGNKLIIDDLHLSSSRSHTTSEGDFSDDSETLRNSSSDYQPMKVVIRRSAHQHPVHPKQLQDNTIVEEEDGSGNREESEEEEEQLNPQMDSPRTLFLGFCE